MDEVASESAERVGERLRAARVARGLTLADVAERSRIPLRHLASIERGDYADLPALPYSTGFVKVYGNMVGEDGNALSRAFRIEAGEQDRAAERQLPYEPADPKRVPSLWIALAGVVIAILLAVGYLLWRGGPAQGDIDRSAAGMAVPAGSEIVDGPTPGALTTPPVAPASANGPVTLAADRDVWLSVYERSGARLFMGVLKAGDSYVVPDTAIDPLVQTGRPEGLRVTVGDRVAPPLGEPSARLKDVSLKPAALLAPRPAAPAPAAQPPVRRPTPSIASEPAPANAAPTPPVGRPSGQSPPTQPPA